MTYDARPHLCRRCLDMRVPEGELIEYLDRYVSELPDDVRADAKTYSERLEMCSECEYLSSATCRLCGCYVQARCAKKKQKCPIPYKPRWSEVE